MTPIYRQRNKEIEAKQIDTEFRRLRESVWSAVITTAIEGVLLMWFFHPFLSWMDRHSKNFVRCSSQVR